MTAESRIDPEVPGSLSGEEIARLPKKAQAYIRNLKAGLRDAVNAKQTYKLELFKLGYGAVSDPTAVRVNDRYRDDGDGYYVRPTTQFHFDLGDGPKDACKTGAVATVRLVDSGTIEIMCDSGLVILPQVSNVVRIKIQGR